MKKLFFFLFASLFLIGLINADSCTPDSGYNKCAEFTNIESYETATATSHVKLQINEQLQGIIKGGYAVGEAWIPYKFEGDYYYLYENLNSFSQVDNWCDNTNGCSNFESTLPNQGKYYLVRNPGDSYSGSPLFVVHDYDCGGDCANHINYWAESYTYAGLGWWGGDVWNIKSVECYDNSDCISGQFCDKSSSWENWNCVQRVCDEGATKCSGYYLKECIGNQWVSVGNVPGTCCEEKKASGILDGACGIDCILDTHCNAIAGFPDGLIDSPYCKNNDVYQIYRDHYCLNYQCDYTEEEQLITTCGSNEICEAGECKEETYNCYLLENNQCTHHTDVGTCMADSPCPPLCSTLAECESYINLVDCTTNADCPQDNCFGMYCENGVCVPGIGMTAPPCEGAVWVDYPNCEWDTSNCIDQPNIFQKIWNWITNFINKIF